MIAEKKLGIAVIGCGAISHNAHLPGINASNFELRCCLRYARRTRAKDLAACSWQIILKSTPIIKPS